MHPCRHQGEAVVPAGTSTAEGKDAPPEQLDGGAKQQGKRASRRKQTGAAGKESSQPGAPGRGQGKLPGGIFSEHTLGCLADGLPSHPSDASQLPIMAAGDLPDNLPAEPLVFWPPAAQDALSDAGQPVQVRQIWASPHSRAAYDRRRPRQCACLLILSTARGAETLIFWPMGSLKDAICLDQTHKVVLVCRPQKRPHGSRTSSRLSWGRCLGMETPGMQPLVLPPRHLVPPSAQKGHLQSCLRRRLSEAKLRAAVVHCKDGHDITCKTTLETGSTQTRCKGFPEHDRLRAEELCEALIACT